RRAVLRSWRGPWRVLLVERFLEVGKRQLVGRLLGKAASPARPNGPLRVRERGRLRPHVLRRRLLSASTATKRDAHDDQGCPGPPRRHGSLLLLISASTARARRRAPRFESSSRDLRRHGRTRSTDRDRGRR